MIESDQSIKGVIGLKTLRELLGDISQEELGRRISASVQTVSRWERGGRPMLSIPQVKALEAELESIGLKFKDLADDLSLKPETAHL
jgi:transcriptional regulator with XRE-family HTH domain